MRLSVVEGSLFAVMFGLAESYFVADAIRLGATAVEVALVVGLPLAIGGCSAMASVALLEWARARRPIVLLGVIVQALVLFVLSAISGTGSGTPIILIAAVCGYHACAQLTSAPWASWFGDVVAARIRGRYFSERARLIHLVSFLSLLLGGVILQLFEVPIAQANEELGGRGFAILYALAGLARVGSAVLFCYSPEPPYAKRGQAPSFDLGRLRPGGTPGRVLPLVGVFYFVVYLGSPFFTPFMLEDLRLEYVEFTLASAAMVLAKVVYMRAWGRSIDHYGSVGVYALAVFLVALTPAPWIWANGLAVVLVAQIFSGFSWAAHEVAFFTLMLETSDADERPRVYAFQSLVTGVGQCLGGLAGGLLLAQIGGDYVAIFALSTVARLAVAVVLGLTVRNLRPRVGLGSHQLLWRVIGMRPHGGVIHRPLPKTAESAEPTPTTAVG